MLNQFNWLYNHVNTDIGVVIKLFLLKTALLFYLGMRFIHFVDFIDE